jgi:rhodanese-related sulfurtransferase
MFEKSMPKLLKEFIIIALLTSLGSAYSLVSGLAPLPWVEPEIGPNEIRVEDARVLDVIWIDARSAEDFADRHIPGALFYDQSDPSGSMAQVLEQWLQVPRVIVVYCADEGCGTSRKLAEELRQNLPEAEIYSLRGGWEAWSE